MRRANLANKVNVFCYGSNLHQARLLARVPGALFIATGMVAQRRIVFHKRGRDGSAKADAFFTGKGSDCVWGAVYAVPHEKKPLLDACESLGVGYDEVVVSVQCGDQPSITARLYTARREAIADGLLPFCWYKAFVVQGACQHNLPPRYVRQLEAMAVTIDPDIARRRSNELLLWP